MTFDPYPDLPGEPVVREELDDADTRLLQALSTPGVHVVTATEDEPLAVRSGWAALPSTVRRGPLTPVFQEPPD